MLSSLNTVFRFLRLYYAPPEHLLVFTSGSCDEMDEQLVRKNSGMGSNSVAAVQFLREWLIKKKYSAGTLVLDERRSNVLDSRRVEIEWGAGSDHDLPYSFSLPGSWQQVLAWVKLLAKVHAGELPP